MNGRNQVQAIEKDRKEVRELGKMLRVRNQGKGIRKVFFFSLKERQKLFFSCLGKVEIYMQCSINTKTQYENEIGNEIEKEKVQNGSITKVGKLERARSEGSVNV